MSDAPGLTKYWVFTPQLLAVNDPDVLIEPDSDDRITQVYLASEVEARDREMKDWLQDFIESNSCTEQGDGRWKCHQCEQYADPSGDFAHFDDCDIVTAKALLGRLR